MKRLLILIVVAFQLYAESDMINNSITVTGFGDIDPSQKVSKQRFGALRVAEGDALRELISTTKGIFIDSKTTVKDFMLESDVIKARIEGVAKFYETIGSPVYNSDKGVELTIKMSLNKIDWKNKVVKAIGIGSGSRKSLAMKAAKIDAKRKLSERIKGLYLTSNSITRDGELKTDKITMHSQAILTNTYMVKDSEKYFDDGSAEVTYEVKLGEDFKTVPNFRSILLKNLKFENSLQEDTNTDYNSLKITNDNKVYTGLIIDCRSIKLFPALAPKIYAKSGDEVYGSINVSREFAISQGLMGYEKELSKAKSNPRVGKNPLIIKATKSFGDNKTDIIIDNKTAKQIQKISKHFNFLRECRVIAIIK